MNAFLGRIVGKYLLQAPNPAVGITPNAPIWSSPRAGRAHRVSWGVYKYVGGNVASCKWTYALL